MGRGELEHNGLEFSRVLVFRHRGNVHGEVNAIIGNVLERSVVCLHQASTGGGIKSRQFHGLRIAVLVCIRECDAIAFQAGGIGKLSYGRSGNECLNVVDYRSVFRACVGE